MPRIAVGLDFGTEACRAVCLDIDSGKVVSAASSVYENGVITKTLPSSSSSVLLPPHSALQHPLDWIRSASESTHAAIHSLKCLLDCDKDASALSYVGIGVAFTSCTILPVRSDGSSLVYSKSISPLSTSTSSNDSPSITPSPPPTAAASDEVSTWMHAWPKLWKHHSTTSQAERITNTARRRNEPWLGTYGGSVGLEWMLPKVLEAEEAEEKVESNTSTTSSTTQTHEDCDLWIEGGDYIVWLLTSASRSFHPRDPGCHVSTLIRSKCQAGYKGCFSEDEGHDATHISSSSSVTTDSSCAINGYPSLAFLTEAGFMNAERTREKIAKGKAHKAPGTYAGMLQRAAALALGLPEHIPVSTAIIDAHAGVVGAGVSTPSTLVLVMGTSACHMIMSPTKVQIKGVAGVVKDGILPHYYGYETGQASVGDAFSFVHRLVTSASTMASNANAGDISIADLTTQAAMVPPGANGVLALDYINGARTPLMDGKLSGLFLGLTLSTTPAQLFRSMMEATAFGVRWIVDLLETGNVEVCNTIVASGGIPQKNAVLMQIYADVLGKKIQVASTEQPVAVGAAILGCCAASDLAYSTSSSSSLSSSPLPSLLDLVTRTSNHSNGSIIYEPRKENADIYSKLYSLYRRLAENEELQQTMRDLHSFR